MAEYKSSPRTVRTCASDERFRRHMARSQPAPGAPRDLRRIRDSMTGGVLPTRAWSAGAAFFDGSRELKLKRLRRSWGGLGLNGPSPCLFAFLAFDYAGGPHRAKATACASLRAQGSHSWRARCVRAGPTVRPDLALRVPMPAEISIARRQTEQAATRTPDSRRKVPP